MKMIRVFLIAILACNMVLFNSCSSDDDESGTGTTTGGQLIPVKVTFDDVFDQVFTFNYDDKNRMTFASYAHSSADVTYTITYNNSLYEAETVETMTHKTEVFGAPEINVEENYTFSYDGNTVTADVTSTGPSGKYKVEYTLDDKKRLLKEVDYYYNEGQKQYSTMEYSYTYHSNGNVASQTVIFTADGVKINEYTVTLDRYDTKNGMSKYIKTPVWLLITIPNHMNIVNNSIGSSSTAEGGLTSPYIYNSHGFPESYVRHDGIKVTIEYKEAK